MVAERRLPGRRPGAAAAPPRPLHFVVVGAGKTGIDAVLFLLGDDSAMITGTMLPVDGGFLTGPPAQWEN